MPDKPIHANINKYIIRLLLFRMHTAINNTFSSSKGHILKTIAYFYLLPSLSSFVFFVYKNCIYSAYTLLKSDTTII